MIEGRLKAIVANLLGEWIESDKLDLSINIWNDENVRFENVNLKDTIIPVSAPFRLKAGLIGSLTMNIPFKTFGTTPAKITLTDVLVVLSPRNLDDVEKAQEIEALKEEKKAALEKDVLERIHGPQIDKTNVAQVQSPPTSNKDGKTSAKKKAAAAQESQGYYGADGFFGRLVTRLMDNLHVEFKNVHIRFEGTDTSRDLSQGPRHLASGKYAIGCSIGALYAETTGTNWIAKSHNEADAESGNHVVLKLIQATNMSAYVDPHALHFVHSSTHPKVLHATLSRLKAMAVPTADLRWWKQEDGDGAAHTHRFVLAPFHVTLKLTMNIDIQPDKKTEDTPHYSAQFELSRLVAMLDDEQVVLVTHVLESFALHDQWRQAIAQRVRSDEREHLTATLSDQYLGLWAALHTIYTKQANWDVVKKSDAWKQLQTLEQLVSADAAIAMRNSAAFEDDDVTMDPDMSRTSLHDLGEVLGIPAPQINVKFQRGKDLGLKMHLCPETRTPVVDECFGQAKAKTAIKPGLLLVKVDGHDLPTLFSYSTVEDLYQKLSAMALAASVVLTFRHPEVQSSQVTPSQLIALVDVAVPLIELRLVLTPAKQVVASAIFQTVDVAVRGFGPGWFSFHRYRVSARHFYLQESVSCPSRNQCLASSIDQIKHPKDVLPIVVLEMNFLETDHPSLPDKATYATQYGAHVGDLIFIYERTKMLAFTRALADFTKRAFPPMPAPLSSGAAPSTASSMVPLADVPLRIRYDFSVQSLRVFVKAVVQRQRTTRAESVVGAINPTANRSIFSQLTLHKAHGAAVGLQDWLKDTLMLERVVASVIHLQRYVRGRNIRRFALPPPRPLYPPALPSDHASALRPTTERQGYLYVHDYRLGSRRWVPLFFVLEKSGVLRLFRTASCADYVASHLMDHCVDVVVRAKDDGIIAPYFATPMSFLSVKFRTTKFVANSFGTSKTVVDTVDLVVASSDPADISMWHFELSRYKAAMFDMTARTPRTDSPMGLRKCMMDVRGTYRGWLFRQDCTLAFRRWHEHYVYLDEFGQLRFYEDNTARVLIDEETVEDISSVVHVGNIVEKVNWEAPRQRLDEKTAPQRARPAADLNHLGPAGELDGQLSYCIEVTIVDKSAAERGLATKPSSRSFLLASYSFDEIADWRHILWEKRMNCRQDPSLQQLRRPAPTKVVSWPAWWRAHLGVRFSNTAKPNHNVRTMYSNLHKWISLYTNHVSGTIFFHDPPPSAGMSLEQAGAILAELRLGRLEVRDRRSAKPHCLVYVGDTFLEFERGKLKAVAINSEQLQDKGQLTLTMQFCGTQMKDKVFGETLKPGLCLGLQFSGCILPNAFQQVLTDALRELAPMWEDPSQPPQSPSTEPFMRCHEVTLDVRVGMFEAYIEEKHCVAKFLMEGNELSYFSSSDRERVHLALASTSLHVMTTENQLRLAQIDGVDVEYELLMQTLDRMTIVRIDQVKLEADGRMRVLYQLFEALQLFEEDDEPLDDYNYDNMSMVAASPLPSPIAIAAPVESMRPRHVRNESGVSMRSQRSFRGRRSQTGRNSEFFQTLSYIQPLLTYQTYVVLLHKYNYAFWAGTKDVIHVGCRKVVFEVVKRSLSLVALDTYIPVMKFSVNEIQCRARTTTEFRADFDVDASVTFSARYYNTALADWEPVVEPWEVGVRVDKPISDGSSDAPKPLTIELKARHRLNINFTEALVRLVVSVSKHHKSNALKNSERMLPSSESLECVNVINNLGVPLRLANLNTTNPGVLTVQVRDGWSLPAYTRFHDATVEVILLPWWNPQERSHELVSLNHAFHLSYGGANAGVAPKLRVNVRLKGKAHDHGSVELNLAGNLMGTEHVEAKRVKFCQWHRLRDPRGVVTGEILVALHFTPTLPLQKASTVQTVLSGGSLMVDPFRLGSGGVDTRDSTDGDSTMKIKLPESIRNGYVPPLALEVMVDGKPRSLLCPLQRAGKFFIKGEGVLAEVKVAQRDELRRVLMLSSPKQVKNATRVVLNVGAFPMSECDSAALTDVPLPVSARGRSISFPSVPRLEAMVPVNPGRKYSLPLGALYSDNVYGVMLQVQNSKRTKISELATLHDQVGCHILYLAPLHDDDCGYCFFMEILSHVRNVYREEQFDTESSTADIISHDAKYQIQLHAGFVFENALPIRLKYKLEVPSRFDSKVVVAEGTLAPGDDVELLHFHKQAFLFLSAPDEASSWSPPISLAKCISQEGTTISNQTISRADEPEQRRSTDTLDFVRESPGLNDLVHNIVHLFTARLDYTVADNGSPRTVIYCSVWIYNYSHVNDLLVRCSDNTATMVTCPTMKDQPKPRLMDCPGLALELNTVMNHEPGRWSERIHAGVVGVQKSLTLKGIQREKHEVGVAIQRPMGQFHRTAQVIISPRYVVVNYTRLKFIMASEAHGRGRNVEIAADTIETPFDYPGDLSLSGKTVCLKAGGGSDRNYLSSDRWSGLFSIENEDEFTLWLPGARVDEIDNALPRIRVKVHTVGATILIKLTRDDPPMLSVRNDTEFAVKLFQVHHAESVIIPPNGRMPFAWESPDSPRKVSCSILMEQTATGKWTTPTRAKVCDFDSLDSEEAVVWELKRVGIHVAAEVKLEVSSRTLVFRNAVMDDFRRGKYKLEVKVVAVRRDVESTATPMEAFVSLHTDDRDSQRQITPSASMKGHGVYRFEHDLVFPCMARPRQLFVELIEREISTSLLLDIDDQPPLSVTPDHVSPRIASFHRMDDAPGRDLDDLLSNMDSHWNSPSSSSWSERNHPMPTDPSANLMTPLPKQKEVVGTVDIKIPQKMWKQLRTTDRKLGDLDGSWWPLTQHGVPVGSVQLAIKCTMFTKENDKDVSHYRDGVVVNMHLSSLAVSFVHNTNRLDVAYLIMQRVNVLYESHKGASEVSLSVGNVQMDNQMDRKVVLGPRGYKRKEGVSVRLRDRWRQCLSHKHKKLFEQFDIAMLPVVQLRMLYNDTCSAGSFHVELVELILQELEITTDEKFVVNLISVFQGLESLSSSETFESVLDQRVVYADVDAKPITDGLYIEQLDVESIRILFSLELNGGKHIATLGPSGRRLATYLPVSNVKDLRLYFSKLLFTHIYDSQTVIIDKLYRHYMQQALLVVLQGLYTVTLFVNPFRIIYRLGHGVLEVVRLPARGLASGSPVELLSGAYLGVRSLAMNTISASYEAVAGATGAVSSIITPMIFNPEKKHKFQEEMVNFQRAVMTEVDAFDAAEEMHMTKTIVRVPRTFTSIGLLVEYGPGSLPMDEQARVDLKAAVLVQNWWRRRLLVKALVKKANALKAVQVEAPPSSWEWCRIM